MAHNYFIFLQFRFHFLLPFAACEQELNCLCEVSQKRFQQTGWDAVAGRSQE